MGSNDENLLIKGKDFFDSALDTFGLMSPDKMMAMIRQHDETIVKLTKKVERLEKIVANLTDASKPIKSRSSKKGNFDTFDQL